MIFDMKRGMTFVAVMSTVAIMLILVSTATISALNVTNNSKKTKYATELAYIKEAVDNYYITYNTYPVKESVTVDLTQVEAGDKNQFSGENGYDSNSILLYVVDKEKLGITETVYGNGADSKDVYVCSKETNNIYYLKGLKIGSTTYYTLTDELKKIINYDKDTSISNTQEPTETDTIPPEINLGNEKKELVSADGSEKHSYITVKVSDNESGIKIAKFEREILEEETAKTYFKTNGIELQEDIIEIDENTKGVTVYVEDNAGNVTVKTLKF